MQPQIYKEIEKNNMVISLINWFWKVFNILLLQHKAVGIGHKFKNLDLLSLNLDIIYMYLERQIGIIIYRDLTAEQFQNPHGTY